MFARTINQIYDSERRNFVRYKGVKRMILNICYFWGLNGGVHYIDASVYFSFVFHNSA